VTRVLLDINVLLDVILDRRPGVTAATHLWARLEQGHGQGVIPAHGVTTVFYILERAQGAAFARRAVERLLQVFAVAAVTDVVSRDAAGFPDPPLPVVDPAAALGLLLRS